MKLFTINREPFRAERKLFSFYIGAGKHLHSLFCPKGFFIFKGVTKRYLATLSFLGASFLLRVVEFFGFLVKQTTMERTRDNFLFGQNQQANLLNSDTPFWELHTTKVAHAFFKNPTQPLKSLHRLSTHRANINTISIERTCYQASDRDKSERVPVYCERRTNLML